MSQTSPVSAPDDIVERMKNYIHGEHDDYISEVLALACSEINRLRGLAKTPAEPVQDTWLVGGPDLKAMSGSVESDRVIQLHFRRPATDQDRKWLLEAINAKIAADRAALSDTSSDRPGKDIRAAAIEECAKLIEGTELRNPENIAAAIRALVQSASDRSNK